jgi:hypothetical protein
MRASILNMLDSLDEVGGIDPIWLLPLALLALLLVLAAVVAGVVAADRMLARRIARELDIGEPAPIRGAARRQVAMIRFRNGGNVNAQ